MQRKTKKPKANLNTLTPMRFDKPTEQPCLNRSSQKKSRLQQSQTHNATATAHTGPKRTDGPQTPAYTEAAAESIQRSRSPTPQALILNPPPPPPSNTTPIPPPPPPRSPKSSSEAPSYPPCLAQVHHLLDRYCHAVPLFLAHCFTLKPKVQG